MDQENDIYTLFAIYIEDASDDFDPHNCTFEEAEFEGQIIKTSKNIGDLLDVLIASLNNEQLTDHNWYIVFENQKLYIS